MPLNGLVLGAAALVSSPALWAGFVDGTMPVDVALTRFLLAVGVCWAGLSVLQEWALPAPGSVRPRDPAVDGSSPPDRPAPATTSYDASAPDPFADPNAFPPDPFGTGRG